MRDLLEHLEEVPEEVKAILGKYEHAEDYPELGELVAELNAVGFTCDYDLGGTVFGLRALPQTAEGSSMSSDTIASLAEAAVNEMGDIFFDPDASFGEFSIPRNIASNACSDAIVKALQQAGVSIAGDVRRLAESQAGVTVEGTVPQFAETSDPEAGDK